jgi:hypothetical protein
VSVNFRQNLLGDVSAWAGAACKAALEDLEFRDNQLKEVHVFLFVCLFVCSRTERSALERMPPLKRFLQRGALTDSSPSRL